VLRKFLIDFLAVVFLLYGVVFMIDKLAQAAIEPAINLPDAQTIERSTAEFLTNICKNHSGVNCSILNADASIVCNDGTKDTSPITIYAIPQCQKTLEEIATQESDFMAETGCFPPSEMGCFNETSYQNLYNILTASGLANSELGKSELAQCREQISGYATDSKNYRQCLTNNNRPQFEPSGKMALPILKAMFCPIIYGEKSSYNQEVDLCLCDKGYFMDNGKCTEATTICRSKYGSGIFAKNGNCSRNVSVQTPVPVKSILPKTTQIKPSPNSKLNLTTPTMTPMAYFTPEFTNQPQIENIVPETDINLISSIIGKLLSGLKNILKLF